MKSLEGFDLHKFYESKELPADAFDPYIDFTNNLFETLGQRGNTKEEGIMLFESMMGAMQGAVLPNLKKLSSEDSMRWNASNIVAVAVVHVMLRNPMYGSEALTIQLREEVRSILSACAGIVVENK